MPWSCYSQNQTDWVTSSHEELKLEAFGFNAMGLNLVKWDSSRSSPYQWSRAIRRLSLRGICGGPQKPIPWGAVNHAMLKKSPGDFSRDNPGLRAKSSSWGPSVWGHGAEYWHAAQPCKGHRLMSAKRTISKNKVRQPVFSPSVCHYFSHYPTALAYKRCESNNERSLKPQVLGPNLTIL